ncbi:hypothetical protein F5878DRAFT_85610 [Lentinula raphanica]|uniref:G1/S-specific cyclin pas1 n=1 Tax=Lentinula raphanica TaxID=153919 RepID=A0AA38PKI9_9AGAR|nr:hypothetical protein F5878DRAFT_85610 [Lentinula raphanica]
MYSIHSLAHRAPASRARVRWQPYGNLPPSGSTSVSTPSSSKSPSSISSNSPFSSAPTSPISAPPCDAEPPKQQHPQSSTPQPPRDAQPRDKNKYALGLVDQAVKSLCEIWRPQDIPQVFLTTSRAAVPAPASHINQSISTKRNCQHPSQSAQSQQHPVLFATGIHTECDSHPGVSNLVPMKGFVHEVLRRSRTSGSVLQTALCYLEAIRPRIPEIAQSDDLFKGETELADRITVATEEELAREAEFCIGTDTILISESDDSMDTVRVSDSYSGSTAVFSGMTEDDESTLKKSKAPSPSLSPLPSLPSPLLCPRRAFLASLILASKFTQDKCYSNRAWAKLSGLPPREVGRCERALGDALDWRLWVGKSSSQSQASPSTTPAGASNGRPLARCRSESVISASPAEAGGFVGMPDKKPNSPSPAVCRPSEATASEPSRSAGLRRAVTLPADAFAFDGSKQHDVSRDRAVARWIHQRRSKQDQAVDMEMYSPHDASGVDSSSTNNHGALPMNDIYITDTCPPTPGLTYSPTSTESSSGDRTIQMPCFFDDKNMVSMDGLTPAVGLSGKSSDSWSWLDSLPTPTVPVLGSIGHDMILKRTYPVPPALVLEKTLVESSVPMDARFPSWTSNEFISRNMFLVE